MTDQLSEASVVNEVIGWWRRKCVIPGRLDGKIAIVTGANTGIGAQTVAELARRGCTVIMACRNMKRAETAKNELLHKYGPSNPKSVELDVADASVIASLSPVMPDQLVLEQLNLAAVQSIREFVKRISKIYPQIHFLINNAGVWSRKFQKTEDGFEWNVGVNHLGHFLLTHLLLPQLRLAAPSRIINVSSILHHYSTLNKPEFQLSESDFDLSVAYGQSKLANIMHARELSKRLDGSGITAISLHPGVIRTELFRDFTSWKTWLFRMLLQPFMITPWQGAQTTLYAVLTDKLVPGAYYDNCAEKSPHHIASNDDECRWLWEKSCELLGIDAANEE